MKITKEIYASHAALSGVSADFLEFVQNNPGTLKLSNFKLLDVNDPHLVLQAWPTFVNQTFKNQIQEASVKIFELIKSIPKRLFDNDIKKISTYYEIPESLAKLQLEGTTDSHIRQLLARGDYILASSGFKCLEFNVSANIGGWYTSIWETLYLNTPIIAKFLKDYDVKINKNNTNLLQHFIDHIIDAHEDRKTNDKEMNILLVVRDSKQFDKMGVYLNQLYQTTIQKRNLLLKGKVFLDDISRVDIIDNYLYYNGQRIHTLIELYGGDIPPGVMEVFKSGNIRLMNGPITDLLSSKLNLALLSDYEAVNANVFSDEEKAVIDRYVPWSRKIALGDTTHGRKKIKLENYIRTNKDKLVIKPSEGRGGEGVYIGQHIPQSQWEELLDTAVRQKNWLVQEYVRSLPLLYQHGEMGCEPHNVVWGFFVLGAQYGGTTIRVLPQKHDKGVINYHQGAKISVLFEVNK